MKRISTFLLLTLLGSSLLQAQDATTITLPESYLRNESISGYNAKDVSKYYADVNGDGVKERINFYVNSVKEEGKGYPLMLSWVNIKGETLPTHTARLGYVESMYDNMSSKCHFVADLNNDNIPDVFYWLKGGVGTSSSTPYEFQIAYSNAAGGYTIQEAGFTLPYLTEFATDMLALGDFNRDGRVDIFHYEVYNPYANGDDLRFASYLYLQAADGKFIRTPFPETTDTNLINNALYNSGASGSFTIHNPITWSPSSLVPINYLSLAGAWQVLDLNQDGYLDIISATGLSYISLSNGLWYQAAIAGTIGMCDFNADGVKDLAVFDSESGQVDLLLSSPNGLVQSSLYNNANITDVLCEDMDADGKSDILLLANTTTHQYFLFFKNQGDGTFKRTERALEGKFTSQGIYHLNSNGIPTVLLKGEDTIQRVDWDKNFTLTLANTDSGSDYTVVIDYYDDGKFYIFVDFTHISLLSEGATTAPQAVSKPNVIVDSQTGLVKVEWDEATDAETSQPDLDYQVRVQDAAGTKTYLQTRTVGNHSLIFDPTTWLKGDYKVQVRAIDKMNLSGAWSEAVSFTNNAQSVVFTISEKEMYLSDTLVVTSLLGTTLSIQALPDGEIVSNEQGVARIFFHSMGDKTITATGEGGAAAQQTLYVKPFKVPETGPTLWKGTALFDYNQDGKLEGFDASSYNATGFYTLDKGVGTIYPSLNLSDVTVRSSWIVDNNRDGLPDIMGRYSSGIEKNGVNYSVMHNTGDMDFTFQEAFTREEDGKPIELRNPIADFDNDGLVDMLGSSESGDAIYKNNGTSLLTRMTEEWSDNGMFYYGSMLFGDMNNDGYIDILHKEYYSYGKDNIQYLWLYVNKGNFTFEKQSLPIYPNFIFDANYDGYPDLIVNSYDENGSLTVWSAYLGSADLTFSQKIQLIGKPLQIDFDNDGRYDYEIDNNSYVYLDRTDGAVLVSSKDCQYDDFYGECNSFFDIDEDGYPDYKGVYRTTKSRIANVAPTAPTTVYISQSDNEIVVNWEGASDKESHPTMLRYNLSVREKGTNKYIISPLNATQNQALTTPTTLDGSGPWYNHYRAATRYPIPASMFEFGKTYEICVQTIDNWFAHSDFSQVVEFTPSKMLINLPAKGGVGIPVPFSTNSGASATVTVEDGVVSNNTITWNTAGHKTVTVTMGGETSQQTILIVEKPEMELVLREDVLEGDVLSIDLPAVLTQSDYTYSLTCNDENTRIELMDGAKAKIYISNQIEDGTSKVITFALTYQDPIFGKDTVEKNINVHASVTPALSMVTVESTGIRLTWDAVTLGSVYSGKVNIYRETTVADQYELIDSVLFSAGTYLDETALPDVRSYRYVIALPTAYGTEGELSAHHTSIHTMINQGLGNDVNLHWTHYEGAPVAQYTIFAGTSPDNLAVLENISGNAQSYTHKRTTNADTYYALGYTLKSAMAASSVLHRAPAATLEGRSNVICSNEAYSVILVESISISSREGTMQMDNAMPQLHMVAAIEPVRATLNRVAWSIIAGEEYATISSDGTLSLIATEDATGTITVQAKSIDGSEVVATANVAFTYSAAAPIPVTGVSLNQYYVTLNVGNTLQLIATVLPTDATNQAVTWSSNNPSVVSVQNGLVTALAEGGATITVTTEDGGYTSNCTVIATNESIDPRPITLSFKKPADWAAVYLYTWNEAGAQPLGVWPGTQLQESDIAGWYSYTFENSTGVNFIFNSGNGYQSGNLYTEESACYEWNGVDNAVLTDCPEDDVPVIVPVESITLSESALTLEIGDTRTLTATVLPANATNKNYTWSSSAPNIVSVSNGTIRALAAGSATITVTTEDGGKSATCQVTVEAGDPNPNPEIITVRFKKPNEWNAVYLYAWINETVFLGEWPGLQLTQADENGWYGYTFDKSITGVYFIFNSGMGGAQSADLYTEQSVCYEWNGTDAVLVDCPDATAIDNVQADDMPKVRKVFEDGIFYIIHPNGDRYTFDGRKMK